MKTCFAYAYSGASVVRGLLPATSIGGCELPFIVCYHRVVENFEKSARHAIPSMLISTAMLERHIDWLAKRYSIVSLDEIGAHLESPRKFGIYYGTSNNPQNQWDLTSAREELGYNPQDDVTSVAAEGEGFGYVDPQEGVVKAMRMPEARVT